MQGSASVSEHPPAHREFALALLKAESSCCPRTRKAEEQHHRSTASLLGSPGSGTDLGQPGDNSQLGSASFTPRRNPGGLAGLASHLLAIKSLRAWESISSGLCSAANPGDEPTNESCSQLPTGLRAGSPEELFAFSFTPWMSVAAWSLGYLLGCEMPGREHTLLAEGCKALWQAELEPGTPQGMAQACMES